MGWLERLRETRWAWALGGLVLESGAVLLAPPVFGPLFLADGYVDVGPRRLCLWILSTVAACLGGVELFGAWRGVRAWAWFFRHARVVVSAVLLAAIATLASASAYWQRCNAPDWRQAVDTAHPDLAQVASRLAAGETDRARDLLVDHLRNRHLAPGPWSLNWSVRDSVQDRARVDGLRAGRIAILGDAGVAWPEGAPAPWLSLTGGLAFSAHRGDHLLAWLGAYDTAPDPKLLARARDFAVHWPATAWSFRAWPWPDPIVWGDDPGPNRTMALLELHDRLVRAGGYDIGSAAQMLDMLVRHRRALVEPDQWNDVTNHGLMQNAALLAMALALPEFDPGRQMLALALTRHDRYLATLVTTDGVSRELTPGYHCVVTYFLLWHAWRRQASGLTVSAHEVERLREMVHFLQDLRLPDGTLPVIADTAPGGRCDELLGWPHPWPAWRERAELSARDTLAARPALARVWTAGYGLVRTTGAGNAAPPIVATLMAGPASVAHQHADKLSLTLFGAGRPLLAGPGYPPYFIANRHELTSTPAQSALSVDDAAQRQGSAEFEFTDSAGTSEALQWAVLQARSDLYDGVLHRRTLLFGADPHAVLVLDQVHADRPRALAIHERAQGEPTVAADSVGAILSWSGRPGVELSIDRVAWTGTAAATLPVRWDAPRTISRLHAKDAVVATRLSLHRAPTHLTMRTGELVWQGAAGSWRVHLPLTRRVDAQFVPASAGP